MVLKNWSVRIGGSALIVLLLVALAAPWLGTVDPTLFDAGSRDLRPGSAGDIVTLEGETLRHTFLMGSDSFGRDIYSRVLYGTRVSLLVGILCALVAVSTGILCGLLTGYLRWLDGLLMRVMDGIMAIPAILVAISLVAIWRGSLTTVIVAIAIPEIPRVTRLVRSLVLSIREEPYVEAAIALTSCPTASRRWWSRALMSAPSRSWSRRSCPSSASACRPTSRPGATSWPKAGHSSTIIRTTSSSPGSSSPPRCSR